MRQPQPKIERAFRLRGSYVRVVEIHDFDCDCAVCAPYALSDPDRLTAVDMGKLATLGAAVGSAIMFAIDPVDAPAALRSAIGL